MKLLVGYQLKQRKTPTIYFYFDMNLLSHLSYVQCKKIWHTISKQLYLIILRNKSSLDLKFPLGIT